MLSIVLGSGYTLLQVSNCVFIINMSILEAVDWTGERVQSPTSDGNSTRFVVNVTIYAVFDAYPAGEAIDASDRPDSSVSIETIDEQAPVWLAWEDSP